MHLRRITALAAAVSSIALAACVQQDVGSPVSSQRIFANVSFAPSFSESAVKAYTSMRAAGLDVVSARIVLYRLNGRTLIDTTISFPVGTDNLTLELPVEISGAEEELSAKIELKDNLGVVQFSTTQTVTARDANLPAGTPPTVTLQYVGPGFEVKSLSLNPGDVQVQPGQSQDLAASGFDALGKAIADVTVRWSLNDSSVATLTATGGATARAIPKGARGSVVVTATAPSGATATAKLNFLPQPIRIVVISGGGQTGVGNTYLPGQFVVEVQGSDNKGIAGRAVDFRAVTADGIVGLANGSTGADGRASTTMKLGRSAGTYVFQATSGTLSAVTVSQTATEPPLGPPTQIIPLTPLPSQIVIGQQSTQVFSAQIADANGAYLRTAGIVITANLVFSPGSATASVSATTNSQGVFSFTLPIYNGQPGSVAISLTSPTIPNLPSGVFPVVR